MAESGDNTSRNTDFTTNPLRDALEALRIDGWTKHHMHDGGRHCIVGAMTTAGIWKLQNWQEVHQVLLDVVMEQYPPWSSIAGFNDSPHTTFTDVEKVMEKAAVRWDERV